MWKLCCNAGFLADKIISKPTVPISFWNCYLVLNRKKHAQPYSASLRLIDYIFNVLSFLKKASLWDHHAKCVCLKIHFLHQRKYISSPYKDQLECGVWGSNLYYDWKFHESSREWSLLGVISRVSVELVSDTQPLMKETERVSFTSDMNSTPKRLIVGKDFIEIMRN
jgi:hypothetical protein